MSGRSCSSFSAVGRELYSKLARHARLFSRRVLRPCESAVSPCVMKRCVRRRRVKTAILYCYGSGSPSLNVLLLLQYEQRRPYAWTSPKAKQPLGAW